MKPTFKTTVLEPGEPVLVVAPVTELRPVGVFILPTGAVGDKPSLCFRFALPGCPITFLAQFSAETLEEAFMSVFQTGRES